MADTKGFTDRPVNEAGEPEPESITQQVNMILRNRIGFGMDVQVFLNSDIGKYLVRTARAEIESLRGELEDLPAEDVEGNRRVRLELAARRIWQDWLAKAIQEGEAAQETAMERGQL